MPSPARAARKPKPPERRGRKKGAPRPSSDQILEAAEEIFARQGFADTSLRQLMSAAGVSTSAFYARFASRDAVLEALATRFLTELAQTGAERIAAAKNLEEGFDVGVDVLVDAVRGKRDLVRLLLGEGNGSAEVRRGLGGALEQLAGLLGGNLERLVAKGIIEPADAQAVGWAFVGALKIQLERWALFESIETDELGPALRATASAMLPMLKRRRR
jgi:AcrR family transcriptional regulator